MHPEITIAHLTDPHLDLGEPGVRELMSKRLLSWLSWRLKRRHRQQRRIADILVDDIRSHTPDFVAMTGDLVNFATTAEFERGREWLATLGGPDRVAVVPGNHEALVPGMVRAMHESWGGYLRGDDGRPGFPWIRRVGPVAIVGLSTAAASVPFLATGMVGSAQLSRFEAVLALLSEEETPVVVLIHHPPTDITVPRKALIDRAAVRRIIAQNGAALVLHGHTHRSELSWIDGPRGRIPVLGAPCASMAAGHGYEPASWRLLRLRIGDTGPVRLTVEERAITADYTVSARTPLAFNLPSPGLAAGTAAGRMPAG